MIPALDTLCAHFPLLKLNITVQLQHQAYLPAFKGAMWHGLFGHALKAYDERIFQVFYGEHDQQQPKPYAIVPDGDHKREWQKGELLTCELTLFGQACHLAEAVVSAWQQASESRYLGIGEQRTPFKVLSISSATPVGSQAGIHVLTLQDWLLHRTSQASMQGGVQEAALHFVSPVRAKYQGRVLKRQAPGIDFWVNLALRRLTQLSRFWAIDEPAVFDEIYHHVQGVTRMDTEFQSDCYYEDWLRYSPRQSEPIPIGGLKGQVSFYGELAPLLPVLVIGELLQVGGKTTFGLGKYRLIG